jgi:DNA topoisomerase-1
LASRGAALKQAEELETGLPVEPAEAAAAAGLRYVNPGEPGIRRRRTGRGFTYLNSTGARVSSERVLARIKSLAIPPAWTQVWICPSPHGHIQATGRDKKGRKQYIYHPRWREVRDATKYERMIAFGEALPRIRRRVKQDLSLRGLPREKVLAAVVSLLDETHIRVGNSEYARRNRSYGLTTLRDQHVDIRGSQLEFHFVGKSGKEHDVVVQDQRLARIVKQCRDIPGQHLFQYLDENGERQSIHSDDVNDYLRRITGQDFTAKDFRTWGGTVLALRELRRRGMAETRTKAEKQVREAIKITAEALGNTPAVCRRSYIHPAVLTFYLNGQLGQLGAVGRTRRGMRREEQVLLVLLEQYDVSLAA